MSYSSAQTWARRIRAGFDDDIRVSDAERAEVADRLGKHYGDGRLDKEEFDERVARAMTAKTRADLNGLFADLPDLGDPASGGGSGPRGRGGVARPAYGQRVGRRSRGRSHPVLALVLLVVVTALAWNAFVHFYFVPWFLITALVIAVVFASRAAHRGRRYYR